MNKSKTLAVALLITAAATLPLKAAEQCCPPCPNGVLVGVTADSCGACMDLAKFIPGCATADATGCTACETGYTLANGKCTSTQPASITGLHCTKSEALYIADAHQGYIANTFFIPNCTACASNGTGCATCAPGTTRTKTSFYPNIYICQ